MFEIPEAVYFRTGNGIAVNLYSDSVLNIPGTKIEQKTFYPESGKIRLKIHSSNGFQLTLRIPGWCSHAEIAEDGKIHTPSPGWFTIPVNAGTTDLEVNFPMPIRLIRGTMAQTGRAAMMRGPVVYALEQNRNGLTGHEVDLLAIDNTVGPALDAEGIRVPCVIQNRTSPRRDVLFTRFSNEQRTRTYFPTLTQNGLEDDPLYSRQKSCKI